MSDISSSLREAVAQRAHFSCEYCRIPTRGQVATFPIDHILPRVLGGLTDLFNLAFSCPHCNAFKWKYVTGVDPQTNEEVPLFNPRLDVWTEHFAWSQDGAFRLIGKTTCGRATIERLQINQTEMESTRQLLAELGLMTVT